MPLFKFNLCRSTGGAGGAQKPDVSFLEGTSFSRRYEVPVLECVKKKMKLFWQFVKRETRRRCVELRVLAVVCARAFTATYPLPPPFILARSSTGGSLLAHIHVCTRARSLQAKKKKWALSFVDLASSLSFHQTCPTHITREGTHERLVTSSVKETRATPAERASERKSAERRKTSQHSTAPLR